METCFKSVYVVAFYLMIVLTNVFHILLLKSRLANAAGVYFAGFFIRGLIVDPGL